ncbi:MAG: poly-gamma-glutamate biosynthesis protein PgsC/CapC [bacterium]
MSALLQDPALFRLLLVLSVGVAFAVYTRLHLVGGGSVTGGYVAILVVTGSWGTLLGTTVVALLAVAIMRGLVLRVLGLPRNWQFTLSVLVGAILTGVLAALVPPWISLGGPLGLAMTFGAFVIPGLLAYDISHQGFPQTMLALALVTVVTLAVCVPIFLLLSGLPQAAATDAPFVQRIPTGLMPFAVIAAIVIGAVLRFSFGLRSGGFIGALFIVEFFSPEAFLTVGIAALVTHGLMLAIESRVVLTMRQRAMVALMLGALVAWAGLYWASAFDWLPAQEANLYALSPLLATGLMAADMGRPAGRPGDPAGMGRDVLRTLLGTRIAALALAALLWVTDTVGLLAGVALLAVIALGVIPGVLSLREPWAAAERSGKERLAELGRGPGQPPPA